MFSFALLLVSICMAANSWESSFCKPLGLGLRALMNSLEEFGLQDPGEGLVVLPFGVRGDVALLGRASRQLGIDDCFCLTLLGRTECCLGNNIFL